MRRLYSGSARPALQSLSLAWSASCQLALQMTPDVFVVVCDPHASNQSIPSLTRSNFNA